MSNSQTDHSISDPRDIPQRAVNNGRWDAERKRDGDREDARSLAMSNRWDAERKRDGDRQDAAEALTATRQAGVMTFEASLYQATHNGFIAVGQGALDRSLQRATIVTSAAGAIATIYTALLGASYATGKAPAATSFEPALFLGSALVLASIYSAFLRHKSKDIDFLERDRGE